MKHEDLRVVLIALANGARMGEHKADARVTIQTVAGSVRLWLGERAIALPLGGLLVLDRALPHDVEALEESGSPPPIAHASRCFLTVPASFTKGASRLRVAHASHSRSLAVAT